MQRAVSYGHAPGPALGSWYWRPIGVDPHCVVPVWQQRLVSADADVFTYPGSVSISYHAKRQVDLPSDLIMGFKLRKVGPNAVEYEVPCVGGLGGTGSW